MREPRVLRLTIEKKWFDLICSGEKVFEYREYKQHWISRLLVRRGGSMIFDQVEFTNGYGQHRPRVLCEWIGVAIMGSEDCEPDNGEPLEEGKSYFVIALGEILEIVNHERA